ncbi:hypothetical protein OPQ81_008196 [Rhizoctonia solani]|nr:hypothetical protein OPQ81_008196 [Rhizoctonia solani]
MSSMILTNLLGAVIGSAVLARIVYSWLIPKPIPGIPHNPITSIWGDIPAIVKHGGLSQMLVGRQAMVIVSDIRETERLLIDSKVTEQAKRIRQAFMGVSPNSQVALPTDEAWKRHRRLAGPSMSRLYLQQMSSRICMGAVELVKLWKTKMNIVGSCAFDGGLDIQLSTMNETLT